MLLPFIKQPQTAPTEEANQSAVPFLKLLQGLPTETVGESYCTSPLDIQSQLPFWINQNYGSNIGEQYLVSFLQAYYNWMYCGFKKEDINLTPYDIEELLNIDSVPDIFLDEYVKVYAPFITPAAISPEDRQNLRKFLRSIKTDFLISKGTENSYRYLLKILFNVSNVTIDYPKKYLMRMNGGKYIDISWDISGETGIINLPNQFDPDAPVDAAGIIAGGVGYNIESRPNLFGAALNEAVLPDDYFWQEYSYLLTSDAPNTGDITYKDTLLAGAHPAGMLGFFEQYIPLVDTDTGVDNNGDGVITSEASELPVIGRYLLMNPGITFSANPASDVLNSAFYNQFDFSDACDASKNYSCYCCTHECDPYGVAVAVPQHKVPSWDPDVSTDVISSSLAHMKIGSFYELDSTNGISPNILYASCNSGGCAFCSPGPENPVGMTAYQSDLNLLRFSDQDTYGFIIERNGNNNSIDFVYPKFPYVSSSSGFTGFGDLLEAVHLSNDIASWESNLEGFPFLAGAAGKQPDKAGAARFITEIDQSTPRGISMAKYVQSWIDQSASVDAGPLNSYYDVGDTQRRGSSSKKIQKSTIKKYQWFDFGTNEVMGSNSYSIAAGYIGGTFITNGERKISVPITAYNNNPNSPTASIYKLILNEPSQNDIDSINPSLGKVRELFDTSNPIDYKSIDQTHDQVLVTLSTTGSVSILFSADFSVESLFSQGDTGNSYLNRLVYFDADYVGDGFLTDDSGEAVFIENKDFVDIAASGGLLSPTEDIIVWCLHKSGKLYGVSLYGAVDADGTDSARPRAKFVTGTKNRHPLFGTASAEIPQFVPNWNGEDRKLGMGRDEFKQKYIWNLTAGINTGVPVTNGMCKEVAYALNLIPKVLTGPSAGRRFPVINVRGGYQSGGVAVCVDPNYTGYLPTNADNFAHPTQMCEVVKFMDYNSAVPYLRDKLKKIQRHSAVYNSVSGTWSYSVNADFDKELYNAIFGVTILVDGVRELMYVPPRCVSIMRFLKVVAGVIPGAGAPGSGTISILGNNGNWTPISANETLLPCGFSAAHAVTASDENLSIGAQLAKNKINLLGDFGLTAAKWDYSTYGNSPLFNGNYGFAASARFKFGATGGLVSTTSGTSYAGFFIPKTVTGFTVGMFDDTKHYVPPAAHIVGTQMGWGNPIKLNGSYHPEYNIPPQDGNTADIYGFSPFDYFGNTASDNVAPSHLIYESNYINNNHIVKTIGYKDAFGKLPVNTAGVPINGYDMNATITVMGIADEEKLQNHFAWIHAFSETLVGIRADGTMDVISFRSADYDGFIWDPFVGSCFPSNRQNASGITFANLLPAGYTADINTMKKVGSYVNGTYETYNYNLPFIFGSA